MNNHQYDLKGDGKMSQFPQLNEVNEKNPLVTVHTNQGDFTLELFPEVAPKTVENFITHAKNGYYDGVIFHRVIEDFMIQGGDPLGNGTGGPGYTFDDEIDNSLTFADTYLLAMANAGTRMGHGTNGSQFFITTVATPWLQGKHTIFGKVVDEDSRKVVDAIEAAPTDGRDRPLQDVVINSIDIVE